MKKRISPICPNCNNAMMHILLSMNDIIDLSSGDELEDRVKCKSCGVEYPALEIIEYTYRLKLIGGLFHEN